MLKQPLPRLTLLACAALMAGLSQTAQAAATMLTAESSAMANGNAATPVGNSAGLPPVYVSSNSAIDDGFNNASGFSFANSTGAYAVSSNARGVGEGQASTSLVFSFTNTGIGQAFVAGFHLYGGSIGTSVLSALTPGESLQSSYTASIKVGGQVRFATSATLTTDSNGSSLATSGTVLNASDDGSDGVYDWSATDLVLDLGFLGTGDSVDILAELLSSSQANVGTYGYDCGGGGYDGYGGYDTVQGGPEESAAASTMVMIEGGGSEGSCTDVKGSSSAFYGDPFTVPGISGGSFAVAPANQGRISAVPEPGALALVGLALAGLALGRRRSR